jgi:hypothetical protein
MDKGNNWVLGKLLSVNASFSGVWNVSVCYESLAKLRPPLLGSTRLPIGPNIRTEIIHRPGPVSATAHTSNIKQRSSK